MSEAGGAVLASDRLFDIAERDTDRLLVVDPRFGRLTYGDVAGQVRRLAAALHQRGLEPGDIVILQLPNWAPFLIFHLALTAIGAVTITLPITYREKELTSVIDLTNAKALVVPATFHGFDYGALARRLGERAPGLGHVILVGDSDAREAPGVAVYESLMTRSWESRGGDAMATIKPALDDVAALAFTSGTTGDLKGAVFDTHILHATNLGFIERYGLNADDIIFGCSPLGHAVGFTHALRMTLTIGGRIVLLDRWQPGRALEIVEAEKCTFMACATPFLLDLVYHADLAKHGSLASVRLFLCGGASIPEQLMRDARAALPHTFTSPLWGMTECGGVTTCPFDAPEEKLYETDGVACHNMELKVVDGNGDTVPPGTDGELMARGDMVTRGYFRQDELTRQSFLEDGFFRTGDQARMDADGYIKITGRIKDLIIRGGVNISPVEVESVLFAHPKVANVAVVGMPDERLGERSCAYVVLAQGVSLDLAEVRAWMDAAGVAKPKWPERIEAVDALPMTPSGKVRKFRLRKMIAERLAAEDAGQRSA
jgi:cyclohexanecarboxylate-CoA ligase